MYGIPLKFIIGGIGSLAVIGAAIIWLNGVKADAFEAGQESMAQQYRAQVAENDRLNRALEAQADTALRRATIAMLASIQRLDERSGQATETVTRIIRENPELQECVIPQEIIDARNEARQ